MRNDSLYSIVRLGELVAQRHNQILLNTGNMQQCVWQCFLEGDAYKIQAFCHGYFSLCVVYYMY